MYQQSQGQLVLLTTGSRYEKKYITKANYLMQVKYRICAECKVTPGSQCCFAKTFGAQDSSPASKA